MQIARGVHTQIHEENDIARTEGCARRTVPRIRLTEGKPDYRGACHGGPCAHAGRHSAEVQRLPQVVGCIKGRNAIWIAQNYFGWERNFVGAAFPGLWLLRKHGWPGWEGDCGVHPDPEEEGHRRGLAARIGILKSVGACVFRRIQ